MLALRGRGFQFLPAATKQEH